MNKFAPLYSTRERIHLVLKILAVVAPVYLLAQFWLFPWLQNYASFANCHRYGNINGVQLLMYGVFVFIPLSLALLIWLLESKRCLRILRIGQNPLPLRPGCYDSAIRVTFGDRCTDRDFGLGWLSGGKNNPYD
ncbi:MAG: hypothetical protein GY802_01570 [Gammaproteobacteria bacterium]|nr:hypothetical protein [Gammaproteobacteria bacterium]